MLSRSLAKSIGRGRDEVYVAAVPLRATKGPAQLLMSTAYSLNFWDFQHFMVIINPSSSPHSKALVYDFQPQDPENIAVAVAALSGRKIPGVVLIRKLKKLPKRKCWFVGYSENDAVDAANRFNEGWDTDLRINHHDCRNYANGESNEIGGTMETVENRSSTFDHNHPLYLSPGDVPGAVQVGIQLIGMENYSLWSRAMRLALLTRNKLGFIDGTIVKTDYTTEKGMQWERCNALVVSWLTNNVSRDLLSGILFKSNAHLIWKDLKERFDKANMSRIFQLHKEIFSLTQGVASVSVYYSRLKALWDEYDSIVHPPSCDCARSKDYTEQFEQQRLLQFLMGLNEGYNQARSQILMMTSTPSINQVYALIVQDESQKHIAGKDYSRGEIMEPTALFTSKGGGQKQVYKKNYNSMWCDHCNIKGHTRKTCFKLMTCDHCNMKGHLKENCYQLVGYPTDFKGKKRVNIVTGTDEDGVEISIGTGGSSQGQHTAFFTRDQYHQILKMLNKTSISEASAHLAGLLRIGESTEQPGKVQLPNGDSASVSKIGSCKLTGGPLHWEGEGDW